MLKGANRTQRAYRPTDGVLTSIQTGGISGGTTIQNLGFNFDGLGNLTSRSSGAFSESFTYDNLNRLKTRNGTEIVSYDRMNQDSQAFGATNQALQPTSVTRSVCERVPVFDRHRRGS